MPASPVEMSYLMNGQGFGSVAATLVASGHNTDMFRPMLDQHGRSYYCVNSTNERGEPVEQIRYAQNAVATLGIREWIQLDGVVLEAATPQAKLVKDLRSRGLQYVIPGGWGKTILQHQRTNVAGSARIAMSPLALSDNDRRETDSVSIPLPIISASFGFDSRELDASKNSGAAVPLDMSGAQDAARSVMDAAEQFALGTWQSGYQFGGQLVYGLTTFPQRQTYTLTAPTAGGWRPKTLVDNVIAMKKLSLDALRGGPWILYHGPDWEPYLDNDLTEVYQGPSLRERILKIGGIQAVQSLDFLTGYQMILMETNGRTMRLLIGMEMITVQWPIQGGLGAEYKVLMICVPQPRCDINNYCGIVHANI